MKYSKTQIKALIACLIFIICWFSGSKVYSQELTEITGLYRLDFLITASGDTLKGKLVNNWSDYIEFKVNGKSKSQKFDCHEAKQCSTGTGEIYIRAHLPGVTEMNFVQLLEKGKIKLYEHLVYVPGTIWEKRQVVSVDWYATDGKRPLVRIRENENMLVGRMKKNFLALIAENDDLTKLANSQTEPIARDLRDIIKKFNSR